VLLGGLLLKALREIERSPVIPQGA
jgi:hypothetical protein